MSEGKSDRTNTLGFYQLEMISKEVIPTETLKWEKDALDFSILGKKKFYLVALHQLILKQIIKAVLLKSSPTSFPWSLLFHSLLYLQGKGRREILGTRWSLNYFSQQWGLWECAIAWVSNFISEYYWQKWGHIFKRVTTMRSHHFLDLWIKGIGRYRIFEITECHASR